MSNDSKLSQLHIDQMSRSVASTDDDSDGDKATGKADSLKIGEIQIKSAKELSSKAKSKNIVLTVKSLRSLQQSMGVFSI